MDYNKAIQIGEGIYWVGYNDEENGLHSNPYLIVEGEEAVLIDGGSRPDFGIVMMKILQTGILPVQITRLIYHHYDPDLVGSVSNFEAIIRNENLQVISQKQNNIFIKHYSVSSKINCINAIGNSWSFKTGRKLQFINTPYSHSPGSFVTYDEKTKTLFSSDIFGSYGKNWELYIDVMDECKTCKDDNSCPAGRQCFMPGITKFHQIIMTSKNALTASLNRLKNLDIQMIAPQHGSLIKGSSQIEIVLDKLLNIDNVGIDGVNSNGDEHIW